MHVANNDTNFLSPNKAPLVMCRKASLIEKCVAMSRLGACLFEKILAVLIRELKDLHLPLRNIMITQPQT